MIEEVSPCIKYFPNFTTEYGGNGINITDYNTKGL